MSLYQSKSYARYIQSLSWRVERVDGIQIFMKTFPLFRTLAKIQRSRRLPKISQLKQKVNHCHVRMLAMEPEYNVERNKLLSWCKKVNKFVRLYKSPFLPTKTSVIDLRPTPTQIFNRFASSKRRGVRRALKHGILVNKSHNIKDFISLKNKSAGPFGFLTTYGIKNLWNIFSPKNAAILLAYKYPGIKNNKPLGGVLLLFWKKTAYYWMAGSTKEGKNLFAPTLLVFEALKLSKRLGMSEFDFVGIFDERMPSRFHEWKGFTKFKEGFGGSPRYYPFTLI